MYLFHIFCFQLKVHLLLFDIITHYLNCQNSWCTVHLGSFLSENPPD